MSPPRPPQSMLAGSDAAPSRAPRDARRPSIPPLDLVTPAELIAALGWSRSAFYRALDSGRITAPTEETQGGHARWTPEVAASIVRAAGKAVPASWERRAA